MTTEARPPSPIPGFIRTREFGLISYEEARRIGVVLVSCLHCGAVCGLGHVPHQDGFGKAYGRGAAEAQLHFAGTCYVCGTQGQIERDENGVDYVLTTSP